MNYNEGMCVSPVTAERVCDGLTDELTVPLQGVEGILYCLVDSFLDGTASLLNLVDAATGLKTRTQIKG